MMNAILLIGVLASAGQEARPDEVAHAVCGHPPLTPCEVRMDGAAPRLWPRLVFYGGLGAADLASTELFLTRGRTEGNPLMHNRAVRVASRAVAVYAVARLDQWAERKGRRKLKWAVRIGIGLGTGIIVARNVRAR